jgi:hypothetical protein
MTEEEESPNQIETKPRRVSSASSAGSAGGKDGGNGAERLRREKRMVRVVVWQLYFVLLFGFHNVGGVDVSPWWG